MRGQFTDISWPVLYSLRPGGSREHWVKFRKIAAKLPHTHSNSSHVLSKSECSGMYLLRWNMTMPETQMFWFAVNFTSWSSI